MSTTPLLEQTPILIHCLAENIGTSDEDVAEALGEYDVAHKDKSWSGDGTIDMLRDYVETGE